MNKKIIAGVVAAATAGGAYYAVQPPVIYGDEVRVRLYRGLTGRLNDHATDVFGLSARKTCGIRYYVEGQAGMDRAALAPNSAVRNAKKVILVGTSAGGRKARDMAEALAPKAVDLLLVDTVPWTKPVPKNVENQVTWRNTWLFQLGGGKPLGTKDDRPRGGTHGGVIHAQQTHDEVVAEICRGVTKRPEAK